MSWSALVAAALLGTARRRPELTDLPVSLPPADTPEDALLDAAAALATARLAGCVTNASAGDAFVTHPAPPERLELLPAGARRVLERILELPDDAGLLRVLLDRVEATGRIVPPEHLPELGDVGAAGGQRAAWLAGLTQPEAPAPEDWLTADRRERVALLGELRERDPRAGRELLESTWAEEPPADRAALLRALRPGLSTDDEPLLETALRDKRKPVRQAAHELLAALPESAFGRRMADRLAPLVEPDGVRLPEIAPDWRRDGLEEKPRAGLGAKASLLQQLVAAAPLDVWPSVAVRDEVLDGLVVAAKRQRRADWAAVLLSTTGDPELLALAGPGDATLDAIEDADPLGRLQLLAALPGPWPEDFSREVAQQLRRDVPHLAGRSGVAPLLKRLAAPLHPAAVRDLQRAADRLVHSGGAVGHAAQDLNDRLHLRLAIDRELP